VAGSLTTIFISGINIAVSDSTTIQQIVTRLTKNYLILDK
jgi:hypothetical protein